MLAVSDCKTKVYRIQPIEDKQPEDIERCTIYVASFIKMYYDIYFVLI